MKRILIIGHCRHGKDTVAEMIRDQFGLTFESSSVAAVRIFIYDALRGKYGYKSPKQCFEDRINHRAEWFDLITEYNSTDKARLARGIVEHANIYVGMRSADEIDACIEAGLFGMVIGVYDPRKPQESPDSFNIDIWKHSDIVIPNSGTLYELRKRVALLPLDKYRTRAEQIRDLQIELTLLTRELREKNIS